MTDFIEKKARQEIFAIKPYVPGKPIEEVKRELGLDDIIKLASNENPLGPSSKAITAVEKVLKNLHLYPDSNCYNLKQKLAGFLGVENDSVLIGNGSDELLKLMAETFLNSGDEVIYAKPSFSEYQFTAMIMGAKCVEVPLLPDFKHDLDSMLKEINSRTKLVFICNPNNPTGTIQSEAELDSFMAKVPEDVLVVFDEAYYEYVASSDYNTGLKYLQQGKNVIVFRTFSKIYGLAGFRIGYAVTLPEIAQAIERVREPFNVNSLAQVAAIAAIDDREHVEKSQKINAEGKKYLYTQFEKMGLKYVPTEANFVFVYTGKNSQDVFKELLSAGVIIRSGDIFGYPEFIRVTIGSDKENQRFIDALKTVLAV